MLISRNTGQKIVALVETTAPVCVERFADYPQLGRFTLRDEGQYNCTPFLSLMLTSCPFSSGKTVAIGKITKIIERHADDLADGVANLKVDGSSAA